MRCPRLGPYGTVVTPGEEEVLWECPTRDRLEAPPEDTETDLSPVPPIRQPTALAWPRDTETDLSPVPSIPTPTALAKGFVEEATLQVMGNDA